MMKIFYKIVILISLTVVIGILTVGCYTVILHPRLEVTDEYGGLSSAHVDHVDDCSQCHQGYAGYSLPAGLGSAAELESWRFYYAHPWWKDAYLYGSSVVGSSDDMPQARDMGRRRGTHPGDHYAPTAATSSPAPTPVLTKSASAGGDSGGKNVSSQDDSRRTVGRRRPDTSNSEKRSESRRKKSE